MEENRPTIIPLNKGYACRWKRRDGVTFGLEDDEARSPADMWFRCVDYFRKVGCSLNPEGVNVKGT